MASASIFGGGFFYAPFSQTALAIAQNITASGDPLVFGPWLEVMAATPVAGRWMRIEFVDPSNPVLMWIQLGLGAAGVETLWQPSTGFGFYARVTAANFAVFSSVYYFPVSVPAGQRISARMRAQSALLERIDCLLYYWG